MSQTWRVVAKATSADAAVRLSTAAHDAVQGIDCHHVKVTVYGYTELTASEVATALEDSGHGLLESSPHVERWSRARGEWLRPGLFVEADEDEELPPVFDPAEIDYSTLHVEVRARVSEEAALALCEQLNARRIPTLFVRDGISVGATDERQAAEIENLIRLELGAAIVESRPFTRIRRWSFHHQAVGGYGSGG